LSTATADLAATSEELAGVKVRSTGDWEQASSLRFVLPVEYPPGTYEERCATTAEFRLPDRKERFWRLDREPENLLPHIANYLTGAHGEVSTETTKQSTATLFKAHPDELRCLAGSRQATWTLTPRGPHREIPFRVEAACLVLFRLDLGFFAFDLKPLTESAADWFDALHHLRFFADQRGGTVDVKEDPRRPNSPELTFQTLIEGVAAAASLPVDTAPAAPDGAKKKKKKAVELPKQMFSYAVLFLTGVKEANDPLLIERCQGAFAPHQPVEPPEVPSDAPTGLLERGSRQWLFTSLEGAGMLATGPLPDVAFFPVTLPQHLRREYYFMYLLVTYQRLTLSRISADVARDTLRAERIKAFTAIHERVLTFTGRGLFAQVTRNQHHHSFYRLCQRVDQIDDLHEEVRDEVEAMREYAQSVREEHNEKVSHRLETLIGVITGVLIPLQVAIALFADRVIHWPVVGKLSNSGSAEFTLGFLAVFLLGTLAYLRLWHRDDD